MKHFCHYRLEVYLSCYYVKDLLAVLTGVCQHYLLVMMSSEVLKGQS